MYLQFVKTGIYANSIFFNITKSPTRYIGYLLRQSFTKVKLSGFSHYKVKWQPSSIEK